jgi:uncharacterized protein YecT (DUF1311 family)
MLSITASVLAVPSGSYAASFDCAKVSSTVDKMICENAEISAEDSNLAEAYRHARENSREKKDLIKSQKEWLKKRNKISDPILMLLTYRNRINELYGSHTKNIISDYQCTSWDSKQQLLDEVGKASPSIYYQKCSGKGLNRIIKVDDVVLFPNIITVEPDIQAAISPDGRRLLFALETVDGKNIWVVNLKSKSKEMFTDLSYRRDLTMEWKGKNKFRLSYHSHEDKVEYDYKLAPKNHWEEY